MKTVMEHYGGTIIVVMVVTVLLLFFAAFSYDGEKGVANVMGYLAYEVIEEAANDNNLDAAFLMYQERKHPVIRYDETCEMRTGEFVPVDTCFKATSHEGNEIPVEIVKIENVNGEEVLTQLYGGKICFNFEVPGIYRVYVKALDLQNRSSMIMVKIPVNKEGNH